jgi:hypothetical protein
MPGWLMLHGDRQQTLELPMKNDTGKAAVFAESQYLSRITHESQFRNRLVFSIKAGVPPQRGVDARPKPIGEKYDIVPPTNKQINHA